MQDQANGLSLLVENLKRIDVNQDDAIVMEKVTHEVKKAITQPDSWFEPRFLVVDEEQGFGSHMIAENADHTMAVIITSWPSHRETPPHDHDSWAVIGCIQGREKNTWWDRHDDGKDPNYAKISRGKEKICGPGDIILMQRDDIHSVENILSDTVSVSLHVYGKHFNYTNRHQFDPINHTKKPFIVRQD